MAPKKTSKKKPETASAPKRPKGMGAHFPKKTADRLVGGRVIGTRTETVAETLSPSQTEAERAKVCDALREINRVKDEHKTATAKNKARIAELNEAKDIALRNANAKQRDIEIVVEEWLGRDNSVVRVRTDTGEIIGDRTARTDELQEKLFEEAAEEDAEEAAADQPEPEPEPEIEAPPAPNPEGDFGETGNE